MTNRLFLVVLVTFLLIGCGKGGGGDTSPSNVGGGYTLVVSGGTLNNGSGVKGLTVLATLRDDSGNGPGGAAGWEIKITGPGINSPLFVDYDDGSPSSYISWWWKNTEPESGTYTATASNGDTTLTYDFPINADSNLTVPTLNKAGSTVSWNSISGAGSYRYSVTDGYGYEMLSGYYAADDLYSSYSFELDGLPDGSYIVEVFAETTDRVALQNDVAASPSLASQENMSLASIDIVQGGGESGYSLDVRGGALYEGDWGGIDYYGTAIWASILTTTADPSPPASDWTISVTGPGIVSPIVFTYPRTDSNYIYWDFGTAPESGTYTVSATVSGGATILTQTFTIPDTTAQLPVAAGLAATTVSGGGANVSWSPVTGAASYYVNIWAEIDGVYTEIAGNWVTSTSAVIPDGTLTSGVEYDVYVTACQMNMADTVTVPPATPGSQVDMSDTTFTYVTIVGK